MSATCGGSGVIATGYYPETYVSRDMAIDAGDPSMEGSLYQKEEYEYAECPGCSDCYDEAAAQPASDGQEGSK